PSGVWRARGRARTPRARARERERRLRGAERSSVARPETDPEEVGDLLRRGARDAIEARLDDGARAGVGLPLEGGQHHRTPRAERLSVGALESLREHRLELFLVRDGGDAERREGAHEAILALGRSRGEAALQGVEVTR